MSGLRNGRSDRRWSTSVRSGGYSQGFRSRPRPGVGGLRRRRSGRGGTWESEESVPVCPGPCQEQVKPLHLSVLVWFRRIHRRCRDWVRAWGLGSGDRWTRGFRDPRSFERLRRKFHKGPGNVTRGWGPRRGRDHNGRQESDPDVPGVRETKTEFGTCRVRGD